MEAVGSDLHLEAVGSDLHLEEVGNDLLQAEVDSDPRPVAVDRGHLQENELDPLFRKYIIPLSVLAASQWLRKSTFQSSYAQKKGHRKLLCNPSRSALDLVQFT